MATKKESAKAKGTGHRRQTNICLRESSGWAAEPLTEMRVLEVAKMISEGKAKASIMDYIKESYGIGVRQARCYYQAAIKYLTPDEEDYKNDLISANISRLETIIEKTMNGQQYREAIAALKALNDLVKPSNSVKIEKNDDAEIIEISFD